MARRHRAPTSPLQLRGISPHAEYCEIVRRTLAADILARINHPREIYSAANRALADYVLILLNRNRPREIHLVLVEQVLDRLYAQAWPEYLGRRVEQLIRENERLRNNQREAIGNDNASESSYQSISNSS
eukprot:GHVU01019036.1.p1 GENE.GHVU01019036.1~~GHVU01019036.1.p1  ORF type:complete len:130 (-),score=1.22 GHVU01019036.1:1551-1940(-)